MKQTTKRMQKRLGKGWRSVLEKGKESEHMQRILSDEGDGKKKTEKEGCS